jgi:hypothetical protein
MIMAKTLDAKFIDGNIYTVYEKWKGSSDEYFYLLEKAIQLRELCYNGEPLYSTEDPKYMHTIFKMYIRNGKIEPTKNFESKKT